MMRLLLPIILLLFGLGGGVGAGLMLGGGAEEEVAAAEDTATADDDAHAEEDTHGDEGEHAADDAHAEDDGHGDAEPARVEPSGEGTEFVRINNQFVVPVVRNGAVRSLVVISLSVEVETGLSSAVFNQEPRLRDSFLREMFAHANIGGFDGRFTEAEAMAPLRAALLEAAQRVLGAGTTYDVLITDITRQDA